MSEPASPAALPPPLLIWTLQRSGGTNLTRRLEVLAGLAHGEHEPFNVEREFGHITRDWLARPDRATLDTAMHAACTQRRLIKHCVDLVPWEVSQALAEQSVDLGYRHLFLYREQPRDRLLSLTFAKRSGVWAPGKARKELDDVAPIVTDALPVRWLIERETLCAQRLNAAWQLLRQAGQQPVPLSFEAIYKVPREEAVARLVRLVSELGLSSGDAAVDQNFAVQVQKSGDQNTSDHYGNFPGIHKLEKALLTVERFRPE